MIKKLLNGVLKALMQAITNYAHFVVFTMAFYAGTIEYTEAGETIIVTLMAGILFGGIAVVVFRLGLDLANILNDILKEWWEVRKHDRTSEQAASGSNVFAHGNNEAKL